ncbi:MAG: AAA family ATPase [Lachnospiraceae bacterium]|nr:AAA family ATPase [Lachnospiraceae bacterium]
MKWWRSNRCSWCVITRIKKGESAVEELFQFLEEEGIDKHLLASVKAFRDAHAVAEEDAARVPVPEYFYYGKRTWELALAALLAGKNLLLAGPKATGKNVLAENLAALFGRPLWNVSFHVNVDAAYLIGTDTYNGQSVVFRPGPIWLCAARGGFGVLDEINMAKNEALAVLHAALDFRRCLDVPGYTRTDLREETRFIGTMNYGYAGTRDLNEALTSRFAVLDMPLIAVEDLERLISRRYPDINRSICAQLVKLYGELEKKAESAEISDSAVDLRGLLDAVALMAQGISSGDALEMCIVNKTFDSYERGLIRDVIEARIPADLNREIMFNK